MKKVEMKSVCTEMKVTMAKKIIGTNYRQLSAIVVYPSRVAAKEQERVNFCGSCSSC
jgi:hypothetical protein